MKKNICRFIKEKTGSITVFVGIAMVVILGMGAFVTDMGVQYIRANQLQNAVDAAALAGTEKLPLSDDSKWEAEIVPVAEKYAQMNGLDSVLVSPVISDSKIVGVEVQATKAVNNMLIKMLGNGNDMTDITRKAVARVFIVKQVSEGSGLIPVGIDTSVLEESGFDGSIVLDIDPSEENAVKYGWMFFDKAYDGNNNANSKLKDWMENGYDGSIKIGDEIPWTNGSRASTIMEYNKLIGKTVLVPVYEIINIVDGGKKEDTGDVRIVGFVAIKIESFQPGGSKNKTMRATFIEYANITGTPSDDGEIQEYQVYGSKLIG